MLICIPEVLQQAELKKLRALIAEAAFTDGRKTAGQRAQRVKNNQQMEASAGAKEVKAVVLAALHRNTALQRAALPRSIRPPLINRYEPGMTYGLHVDDALMGSGAKVRSDLSVTVFLSDPGDYDGGELVLAGPFGEQEVKLPAGAAVVYPSSLLHRVAPVTRGERLAAVTWIQSYVRDPAQRELLHDLHRIRERLARLEPESAEADLAFKTYSNLLRMWSD